MAIETTLAEAVVNAALLAAAPDEAVCEKALPPGTTVYHVFGTSRQPPPAGGWLQKWKNKFNMSKVRCCKKGCNKGPDGKAAEACDGAHVQVATGAMDAWGKPWIIVPTCASHNRGNKNGKLMKVNKTRFVYANETLGHKLAALKPFAEFNALFTDMVGRQQYID